MTLVVRTSTVSETEAVGHRLGRALEGGELIALTGPLGAGKTALARGIARGLGVPREAQVSSPTFAIVNVYSGGRLPMYHADFYRVTDAEELYDVGFYDLIGSGGVVCVEWIDRIPEVAPEERLAVELRPIPTGREIVFTAVGAQAERTLRGIQEGRPSRP